MTDKEKICEDLERLQANINECLDDLAIARDRKDDGEELIALRRMESLLGDVKQTCTSVLNSLEEELVSEDLEDAINEYSEKERLRKAENESLFFSPADFASGFKAGAKWQKEKDKESIETAIHHAYHNGRLEMKEQMMAKAKSGTVQKDNQVILDNGTYIDLDPSMQLKPSFVGLKEEDRIKVIIIKDE